jgi:hypothetical protein
MAENSIYQLIRHYFGKLKAFFVPRNVLSFLLFLLLSTVFWFINALDKVRETEVLIPIEYKGLPKNLLVTSQLPEYITVTVKDQGINLLSYTHIASTPIAIELSQNLYEKGDISIGKDQLKGRISRYLLPTTTILNFTPDIIHLKYEQLHAARKQVRLLTSISTAEQYVLTDEIRFNPSVVTVYGPKYILDTLQYIYTERLIVTDLKDTLITNCKLLHPRGVRLSYDEVKVSVFAEMFTEKQISLPLTVINCPENITLKCFPAMINVTFNIGMSHFSKMNQDDIQLIFDYNQTDRTSASPKQKLLIKNNTNYISNIRISPDEVEYIIE